MTKSVVLSSWTLNSTEILEVLLQQMNIKWLKSVRNNNICIYYLLYARHRAKPFTRMSHDYEYPLSYCLPSRVITRFSVP